MPSVLKKMYVPVLREVMFIIDLFFKEALPGKSPWTKQIFLSLVRFFLLEEIPKMIEGRQRLIAVYVFDSEEAA